MPHDIHDAGETAAMHDPDRSDALVTNGGGRQATKDIHKLIDFQQAEVQHWYEKARKRREEAHKLRLAYTEQRFDNYRLLMALAASLIVNAALAYQMWG